MSAHVSARIISLQQRTRLRCALLAFFMLCGGSFSPAFSQSRDLTPLQREIETQRRRLDSSDGEERRDAVMRLGAMQRPESSRVAARALTDSSEIVRATAARAVLSLPPAEAVVLLLPLLQDRKEFVRQEAAYALGETRSPTAVEALIVALEKDKLDGVRGAAAVALGLIGDEAAAHALAQTLAPDAMQANGNRKARRKAEKNEFVRRATARSLGQMRSRTAVPALIAALSNERESDDVRREAAQALGLIGDISAVPALRGALTARDPYLSRIAYEALQKIAPAEATRAS